MTPTARRLSPWQFRKVLGHLDARLAEERTVAGLLGLSGGHLSRGFRASLGMPPQAFGLHRRPAPAMAMMRASSRGLSAIAQDCGFRDQPHPTKCFRRAIGTRARGGGFWGALGCSCRAFRAPGDRSARLAPARGRR